MFSLVSSKFLGMRNITLYSTTRKTDESTKFAKVPRVVVKILKLSVFGAVGLHLKKPPNEPPLEPHPPS